MSSKDTDSSGPRTPGTVKSGLRVALLGVGMMGAFHAEALSTRVRGASVVVVSDYDPARAAAVADRVGARVETDPIAAIHADDVDAVLIASPGAAHEEQVLACLDRGIPALCEKPLTTDVESARAIVAKERALGRPLIQIGFMRRFDAEYEALERDHPERRPGPSAAAALHPSQSECPGLLRLRVHDPGRGRARGRHHPLPAGGGDHQRLGDQGRGHRGGARWAPTTP